MQADMQRTIVMMRPLEARDSAGTGFCRLERRGNRGKLVFTVQGIQREGALHAVLLSQDGGKAQHVQHCGEVRVDARGHGTMTYSVDTMTASATANYRMVCVAEKREDAVELVMTGFFGKGRPFDKSEVQRLTAGALGVKAAADRQTTAAAPPPVPLTGPAGAMIAKARRNEAALASSGMRQAVDAAEQDAEMAERIAERIEQADSDTTMRETEILNDSGSQLPANVWADTGEAPGMSPALGLPEELTDAIWPDSVLALKELFERFETVSPVTDAENETFVSIPMSGGMMGIDHYLLGARLENGVVVAIGYGIPGSADMPPAGLDGYVWVDTPIGGYWMKWEAAL